MHVASDAALGSSKKCEFSLNESLYYPQAPSCGTLRLRLIAQGRPPTAR